MPNVYDQEGSKNPNFKDGLGRSTIERKTRKLLKEAERDLHKCERCSFTYKEQELPRHHKDRNRANNSLSNIEVLCWACHNKEHLGERVLRDAKGRFA